MDARRAFNIVRHGQRRKSPRASESGCLYEAPVSGRMAGFRWCVGASVQTKPLGALAFVGKCLALGGRVVTSFVQSLEAGDFVIGHVMEAITTTKPQQIPDRKRVVQGIT